MGVQKKEVVSQVDKGRVPQYAPQKLSLSQKTPPPSFTPISRRIRVEGLTKGLSLLPRRHRSQRLSGGSPSLECGNRGWLSPWIPGDVSQPVFESRGEMMETVTWSLVRKPPSGRGTSIPSGNWRFMPPWILRSSLRVVGAIYSDIPDMRSPTKRGSSFPRGEGGQVLLAWERATSGSSTGPYTSQL